MIRMLCLIIVALALAGPAGLGANAPPDSDDARYSFNRIDDGYLRLDGRTGQVSICAQRSLGGHVRRCRTSVALEAEIARLQGENAALKKELIARNLPLPGTVKPEPAAAKREEPRLQLPSDADLNKVMTLSRRSGAAWSR